MPRHRLTDRLVQSLASKPPAARKDHFDTVMTGLALRVFPTGVASWQVFYRLDGNFTRDTIGRYPAVSLADARQIAKDRLALVDRGRDPRQEAARQKAEETRRRQETFGALADVYKVRHLAKLRSGDELWAAIENDLLPEWKDTPLRDITRSGIITLLDRIEVERGPYARNRRLSLIRHFLNFAMDREQVPYNAAARLKMLEESARERALSDAELVEVWSAASQLEPSPCGLIRSWILTGQRRGQCAGMPWTEIMDADALWMLPGTRTKHRFPHICPLSDQMLTLLQIQAALGKRTYVFFSPDRRDTPIGGFDDLKDELDGIILAARRAIDPEAQPMVPWRWHDLRRTMRTGLSRLRIPRDIREKCISHIPPRLERVYDQWEFLDEKREALSKWGNFVDSLVNPGTNVVPLHRTRGGNSVDA